MCFCGHKCSPLALSDTSIIEMIGIVFRCLIIFSDLWKSEGGLLAGTLTVSVPPRGYVTVRVVEWVIWSTVNCSVSHWKVVGSFWWRFHTMKIIRWKMVSELELFDAKLNLLVFYAEHSYRIIILSVYGFRMRIRCGSRTIEFFLAPSRKSLIVVVIMN